MAAAVQFVRTEDGVTIAFAAEGDGPHLVLARGWITHLELLPEQPAFAAFLGALQTRFTVVRYDGRGNGLSDRDVGARVTVDELVQDLRAVVEALPDEPVHLWGSSFAGPAAIAFAARWPERIASLILDGTFSSGSGLSTADQRDRFLAMLEMARVQPDGVLAAFSFLTDPDPSGGHEARVDRLRRSIGPDALISLYTSLYDFEVDDLLSAINVPTLVLHRRGSRSIPLDRGRAVATGIPGARFVGLEGRAHNLWEGDAAAALRVMGEFLGCGDDLADALAGASMVDEALPVAVLFTDMVGSTELTGRLGDEGGREVLRVHDGIVRDTLRTTRGREVKHTGDGIMASFPAVSSALVCAAAIQEAVAEHNAVDPANPLHVRIGINVGEPMSEDDDLFGTVVQRAARVCDQADADQILVTNLVRELVAGKGFAFGPTRSVTLKGFEEATDVCELHWSS